MVTRKQKDQEESSEMPTSLLLPKPWDLVVKLFTQFGAVGVVCVLLIIGFNGFLDSHKQFLELHKEELKEQRNNTTQQRIHDEKMREMMSKSIDILSQKVDLQIQAMQEVLKKGKKCEQLEP